MGNASLTVFTKEGCISETVIKNLEVFKRPDIVFDANDVCVDDPVVFSGTNLNPAVNISEWNWKFGDGKQTRSGSNVSHFYQKGGTYPAAVYATSREGCNSLTLNDTIMVYETRANAGADTILATGQPYRLKGSGGDIYNWSPSFGLSDPHARDPIVTPEHEVTYILTTTTAFGCPTTDVINIKVFDGPEIYVPNAFTPNGDGKNDLFRPIAVGIHEVQYFRIYNRYGQLIFSSKDTFAGWDGRTNGKDQPSATYIWQVAGTDSNGRQIVKKGTVTLIR
jgi:gliding motility-associated-like protein